MIDGRLLAILRGLDVKMGLDIVMCLRPYSFLERELERLTVLHPVRTLGFLKQNLGPDGSPPLRFDDPVREGLESWRRSSRNDFKKIMLRLRAVALNLEVRSQNILKPVRHERGKGLFEVVGKRDHARVFVFYDPPSREIIVGSGTYWKLGRSPQKERIAQDDAIAKAADRRDQWLGAELLPGLPDWRVLRGKKP